jgi:hypothetical protein
MSENFYVADRKSPIEALLVPPDFVSSRLEGRKQGGAGTAGGSGIEQVASGGAQQDSRSSPLAPPPLEPLVFVSTENLGTQGTPAVLGGTISSVGNGGVVYIAGTVSLVPLTSANLTSNSANQLTAFSMGSSTGMLTGIVVDSGSSLVAGNLHWGRWTSGIVDTLTVSNLHYVVGDVSTVATLPGTGMFTYLPAGGTSPTNSTGLTGSFLGGSVSVDFGKGTLQLNNWQIGFSGATYSQSTGGSASSLSPSFAGVMTWSCSGTCAATSLGNFSGSFVGANAPGMGVVYLVQDNGNITGAQGFKR